MATDELAQRLGLDPEMREALRQSHERWDGKGAFGVKGDDISIASRLINLADVVEVFRRTGGVEAAIAVAQERSGTQFAQPSWRCAAPTNRPCSQASTRPTPGT
jgi:HD-GYP domain-containing protein (c-di-GMP phosphodiesterase class II)